MSENCKLCKKKVAWTDGEGLCLECLLGVIYKTSPARWHWDEDQVAYEAESGEKGQLRAVIENMDLRRFRVEIRRAVASRFVNRAGGIVAVLNEKRDRVGILYQYMGLTMYCTEETDNLSPELKLSIMMRAKKG